MVKKVEPGTFACPDITLGVTIHLDGEEIIWRGFSPEFQEIASTSRKHPGLAFGYANLFGFTLSKRDRENLRFLVSVTCEVCESVQQGGSVAKWCKGRGLRAVCKGKTPRNSTRPSPLVIHVRKQMFVVSLRQFFGAKKRKA